MKNIDTILFDFDGVIADTEAAYSVFWDRLELEYNLGIENFSSKIKGRILSSILGEFFSGCTQAQIDKIEVDLEEMEINMPFEFIEGAKEFLIYLKELGYNIALVTSSNMPKMRVALQTLGLENIFEVLVTGDIVKEGKPSPMCYLQAAKFFNKEPEKCLVFEDSINGMKSALNADMSLFALPTTVTAEEIKPYTQNIIKNFVDKEAILASIKAL